MKQRTLVLILAGGRGTRLWPYSTQRLPKQFLNINGGQSPFTMAVTRGLSIAEKGDIFISTNKDNFPHVKRQLRGTGVRNDQILIKEGDYETGGSILSAIKQLKERFHAEDADILSVFPSDHFIDPLEKFKETMSSAVAVAKERGIVILGKKPVTPEESYGYIVTGEKYPDGKAYAVKQFVEKPPRATAEQLVKEGNCLWNLGMFIFPIGVMLNEFCAHFNVKECGQVTKEMLAKSAHLSLDRMIVEKANGVTAIEATFNWRDIGSWKAFYEISGKDGEQNANPEGHITVDTKHSLLIGAGKPVVTVGLDRTLIINHPDVLLAISESQIDSLKKAMPFLTEKYPRLVRGLPFVSICTPLSEQRKYVGATVESVLQQEYPLIEHLIVDGTGKETAQLRKEIELIAGRRPKDEKTVDVLTTPDGKKGLYGLLNTAVAESTGEIIGLLNDRDLLEDSTVIRTIVNTMEDKDVDVLWADLSYVAEHDVNRITRFWQSRPYHKQLFKKGWMPPHPTFFVRRWVYEKYGDFRNDLPIAGGYEFMLRVLEKEGVKGCYLPKIVVKMRGTKQSVFERIRYSLKGNLECHRAWKLNGLKVHPWFVFMKPLSKVKQLFAKNK